MKKLLTIILITLVCNNTNVYAQAQPICCPEFTLQPFERICDKNNECKTDVNPHDGGAAGGNPTPSQGSMIIACKNQAYTYLVVPNLTGFTYTWTVVGGSPATPTGNPMVINWGNSSQGFIQVIIKNADSTCRDTIRQKVCLLTGPKANITVNTPGPYCAGQSVCFSDLGSVGAASWYWDFGDGTSSTSQNPCHTFAPGGPYTVTLTVSSSPGGGGAGQGPDCGCKDTAQIKITVLNKPGIDIHTDDCRKMLCKGDTVKYCTSTTGCTGLAWSVSGGMIVGPTNGTCVTVVWNNPPVNYPTSVTLTTTSCPSSVCGNSATLNVPVLYPNLPIQGPYIVCPNSASTYSLPALPGTFYKWTISGGGTITSADSNHNVISVQWGATTGGPYIITCNYNNPYSGCSGTDTIGVYIKPPFKINGPSPVCTNTPAFFNVMGGGSANWTVTPNTGFTPPGPFTNVPNIVLNWSVAGNYTIGAVPFIPANYCTTTDSLKVVVNPTPVLNPITGPNPVCPNQLYTYSVTSNMGGGSFSWIFTSGTGNISAYGPNNSNASVLFTGAGPWQLQASQTVNGCKGTITLNITKVPPPPAITITPGTICSGGTVTATVPGGIPTGGYTWSCTPGAVLLTGQGTTTATFTVNSNATISVSSCGGTSSANVTTTATIVGITQAANPCGKTLTATAGGSSYQWFLNGNPCIPCGNTNVASVTQNGSYTVLVTFPNGCTANATSVVTGITPVTVSISAIGTICNGGSVTLTASVSANCTGATYVWSNGAVGNPITVNTAGSYSVTVTCSNGCTATSNIITIAPCIPVPPCIPDIVINGNNNCSNPVNLTTTIPTGCTPTSYSWFYGDGYTGNTGVHTYNNVGYYQVWAYLYCSDGSVHCDTTIVTIPMVDSFTSVISCNPPTGWKVQLTDASIYLPAYAGYTTTWTTTCGTFVNTGTNTSTIANPVLNVPLGCNPTVTLTISKNGCTLSKTVPFNFPNTPFTIIGNTTPCKGVDYTYSSSFTNGVISYAWNFGDGTTGVTNPITHHFNGSPANPTITLTITDQWGCQFTTTQLVNVITPPALTITPSPIVKICPDCVTPVTTLSANPAGSFTGWQWYHNGTAIGGANSSTYQPCTYDASGNYWVTANNTGIGNCPVTSDTVKVVYYPKPVADIQGQAVQCQGASSPYTINLQNAGGANPNYTYSWTATGPGAVTFSPDNLQWYASATTNQLGTYQFILTVTDITTGCVAKDTFCVYLYQSPTVTVSGPSTACEGTPTTWTVSNYNPLFLYQWSNGATGQTMTTSAPGTYMVSVTDPASGCFGSAFVGTIYKRPYVDLFPIGCDTLCDTAKIIPPLPLYPGQTYPGVYTIKWYVDGNLYFTGSPLVLTGLSLGWHQIYIVVTDNVTGCTSTSGKYDVYIKHCGDCDCKESHWGDIILTDGVQDNAKVVVAGSNSISGGLKNQGDPVHGVDVKPGVKAQGDPVHGVDVKPAVNAQGDPIHGVDIKLGAKSLVNGPDNGKLECKGNYTLKCNQPFTINANYICKDTACPPKVTYKLTLPDNTTQTGNVAFSYNPVLTGNYTLMLYGWCGGKICDSCKITFDVNCDTVKDCCKGSYWKDGPTWKNDQTGKTEKINCKENKTYYIKGADCSSSFTVNGTFVCADQSCPPKVEYQLIDANTNALVASGTNSINIPAFLANGTYILSWYAYCGTQICDSCKIKIVKDCPVTPPPGCCPYEIKIEDKGITLTPSTNPDATIGVNQFTITGLSGVNLTEVRAEVVSYDLSSNFKNECFCKTKPFTWASIFRAGNIGTATPKITMFNSTVHPFNPSGAGLYQNPREVVWNNGSTFNITAPIGIAFWLPPVPTIDCCELNARICVKFTFRDDKCHECEKVICFNVVIKKK